MNKKQKNEIMELNEKEMNVIVKWEENLTETIKKECDLISMFLMMSSSMCNGDYVTPEYLRICIDDDDKWYLDYLEPIFMEYVNNKIDVPMLKSKVIAYWNDNVLNLCEFFLYDVYEQKIEEYIDQNIYVFDNLKKIEESNKDKYKIHPECSEDKPNKKVVVEDTEEGTFDYVYVSKKITDNPVK